MNLKKETNYLRISISILFMLFISVSCIFAQKKTSENQYIWLTPRDNMNPFIDSIIDNVHKMHQEKMQFSIYTARYQPDWFKTRLIWDKKSTHPFDSLTKTKIGSETINIYSGIEQFFVLKNAVNETNKSRSGNEITNLDSDEYPENGYYGRLEIDEQNQIISKYDGESFQIKLPLKMVSQAPKGNEIKRVYKSLIPRKNIRNILNDFVDKHKNKKCFNQILIHRLDRWYISYNNYNVSIYSGNKSIFENAEPIAITKIKGVTFEIYSGIEHYFSAQNNHSILNDTIKSNINLQNYWIIYFAVGKSYIFKSKNIRPYRDDYTPPYRGRKRIHYIMPKMLKPIKQDK